MAEDTAEELPEDVVDRAERLTRLSRRAVDENEIEAYRSKRTELLADHGYTDRIREDDRGDVLVLYPREWIDESGTARVTEIEETDRAVERQLEGAADPDDWEAVATHNEELAQTVRERHGDVHGDNADAFATFVSNHYAKRIDSVSARELEEFRTEYFVRNVWPTEQQRSVVDESLEKICEVADVPDPRS